MTTKAEGGGRAAGRRMDPVAFAAQYAAPIFLLLLIPHVLDPAAELPAPAQRHETCCGRSRSRGLIAIGMTFVILTAGIDLSVGSLVALCGLVAG